MLDFFSKRNLFIIRACHPGVVAKIERHALWFLAGILRFRIELGHA